MSAYGSHRLARLCAAVAVLSVVVSGCDGVETTTPRTTSSPTASPSANVPAGGGMVMIYVKGVEAPFSSELAGVLYPGRGGNWAGARPGSGIGGFGVVVNTDGEFSTNQYVYAPDPKWRKATDPFPHVSGDYPLVVEPGTYTLSLWLHYRLDTFFDGPWGVPDPFLSETTGGRILGYCATTFAVDDQGALVTVTGIPSPASISTWPGPEWEPRCATSWEAVRAPQGR